MAPQGEIHWRTPALEMRISVQDDGEPSIERMTQRDAVPLQSMSPFFTSSALPLNSARSVGEGNIAVKTAKSLIGSRLSSRLRYKSHKKSRHGLMSQLDLTSFDPVIGIEVIQHFVAFDHVPVLRAYSTVTNTSQSLVTMTQLSSLTIGGLASGDRDWWDQYNVLSCKNSWFREAQWQEQALTEVGIDTVGLFDFDSSHLASMDTFSISNRGSFSTNGHLPMGALRRTDGTDTWLWQIESSGSWRWEIGDFKDNLYLAAGGPTYIDHDWNVRLEPGMTFTSIPVACCHVNGSIEQAFAAMTDYRRCIIREHQDNCELPIIFNDYMNCLMGDPSEEKIKSLLRPAARSGAEYFVIDAGWYADDSNWWDDVGLWEPSKKRFPSGFRELLSTIKSKGLIPGLWLEPEVVGVRSIVAKQLPSDAFFTQDGQRVIESGRFQLDYRNPVVRQHMSEVVRRLVTDYGVGYFKFDYNIEVMSGSDSKCESTGAAHLNHQRAYLKWIGELLDRYPGLVIENCSSGAQRMDYAMLATHTLQSTSDQQDPVLYAAIAAAVPTAVLPEQSATWAYPQAGWTDEMNCLTIVNSLLGRIHLSGRLDQLNLHQYELVLEGMDVYKHIRHLLKSAHPFWPLGLPKWHDSWISLGMKCVSAEILLSVWRRKGSTTCELPLPLEKTSGPYTVEVLYPTKLPTTFALMEKTLEVQLPPTACARLFLLRPAAPST